jgi:hypothetical protein
VVHNWVEKFSQGSSKVADDARPGAKWLRQQSKDFHAADGTNVSMLVENTTRNKRFFQV